MSSTKKLTVAQAFSMWKQGTGRKALRARTGLSKVALTTEFAKLAGGAAAFKKLQTQRKAGTK